MIDNKEKNVILTQPEKEIQEIINRWEERIPSFPNLIALLVQSTLKKMKDSLGYTDKQTKENVLANAFHFLNFLGLYLSSPSYKQNPPSDMKELIERLNSFSPDIRFLNKGDKFKTDKSGRRFKVLGIFPPGEFPYPLQKQIGFASGTNMWDNPLPIGSLFVPGNYYLQSLLSENSS